MPWCLCGGQKTPCCGVGSPFTLWFQGLSSGRQAWCQGPLPFIQSSHWLHVVVLIDADAVVGNIQYPFSLTKEKGGIYQKLIANILYNSERVNALSLM